MLSCISIILKKPILQKLRWDDWRGSTVYDHNHMKTKCYRVKLANNSETTLIKPHQHNCLKMS